MKWPLQNVKYSPGAASWGLCDAEGYSVDQDDLVNTANALHAEVQRLRVTQRKLAVIAAFFADTDMLFHLTRNAGVTSLREAYYDPLVQAAIKEASDDEN